MRTCSEYLTSLYDFTVLHYQLIPCLEITAISL